MMLSLHNGISSSHEPQGGLTTSLAVTTDSSWDIQGKGTTDMNSTEDVDEFLLKKDYELAEKVLPAIVYLSVLLVVGITGNVVVLYVYSQRLTTGTYRWFVQALAVYDLLTCTIAIPGEIIDLTRHYTFGASPFCKVFRTVNVICVLSSAFTLVLIAVDRYRRICTPLGKQTTPRVAKILITICTLIAAASSAPASILYGEKTTYTGNPAITGSNCSITDAFMGTIYPLIFLGLFFVAFLSATIIFIVLYSIIGRRVWVQERLRQSGLGKRKKKKTPKKALTAAKEKNASNEAGENIALLEVKGTNVPNETKEKNASAETKDGSASGETTDSSTSTEIWENDTLEGTEEHDSSTKARENNASTGANALTETKDNNALTAAKGSKCGDSGMRSQPKGCTQSPKRPISPEARRLTFMLFLVTLVFVLSFLPFLITMIITFLGRSKLSLALQGILLRTYFINSMANPIIYSFCNTAFKKECSNILRCRCC